ncbi:MAG: efflux transporter outer membrane subunit [Deltaproteobacteria bacterium]|nr:efflux transporter outer membrane subunit [Deltaproteobacteria bacterium]
MKNKTLILWISAILLLSSCSFTPKLSTLKMDLPSKYDNKTAQKQIINVNWWKNFNDSNLNKLIEEALKNNDDLKLAVVRVEEAWAYLGLSKANLYPTINAAASGYRQKTSNETLPKDTGTIFNNFSLSSSVGYELDLWGKLRNQKKAALSSLLASEANREAVKLSLVSNVANIYFNLVSINKQLQIAEKSVKSFKETYKYRQKQCKYGVANELVAKQAKAQYANAKVLAESLKEAKVIQMSALSVLLGRSPKEIFENKFALNQALPEPVKIPAALPSSLLEDRPDIKVAEENLRAKNALIGVARAAYFPNISLTGLFGYNSENLSDLIQSSAKIWGVGPSATIPIFDFGRIKSNVKITEAEKKAALVQYTQTVKNAFKEVFDALKKVKISKQKLKAQKEEAEALKRTLYLSQKRFDNGYSSYLEVLDAQRGFLNARLNLARFNTEVITNEITLYKALGGGWSGKYLQNAYLETQNNH